jgi:pimeloyl-ACP methyl ester carboxylesterase
METAMSKLPTINADFLEAGSGPAVMLVHSSVSRARMWRRLMDDLKDDFHVRAVNLYGYGRTPPWSSDAAQSLDDQARLVETALPRKADTVCVVGHSFGGSVAMKLAARLSGRVTKLVLLETNPFYLLEQAGCADAFAQALELRNCIKKFGALGEWATAAEQFADYWGGAASWQNMPAERRNTFVEALKPNYFEWDAVMGETTPVEQWARLLPRSTLLVSDPNTVLPIREITAILRRSCPIWTYKEIVGGGHMAPLTRPDLINPLVRSFLRLQQGDDRASQPKVLGSLERLAAVRAALA